MRSLLITLGCLVASLVGFRFSQGIWTLVATAGIVLSVWFLLRSLVAFKWPSAGRASLWAKFAMLLASVALPLIGLEAYLQVQEADPRPSTRKLTIPAAWNVRPASVEGAAVAYYWHDLLHVHDGRGLRRTAPLPAKVAGTCRIAVFGDSLTYGYGVAAEETYAALLQRDLERDYQVEVLNLGVSALQSEDVSSLAAALLPQLEPDLVVYGICLNDFLPSGKGQYVARGYEVPLPLRMKQAFKNRTLIARFLEKSYDDLLTRLHVRHDFLDDILKDIDNYQQRFANDVRDLNAAATRAGLPPVVAMVVHQSPERTGRAFELAQIAERACTAAGMQVVASGPYFKSHAGQSMKVSPWEGHPNGEAHALFAATLGAELRKHPVLSRHAKARSESTVTSSRAK